MGNELMSNEMRDERQSYWGQLSLSGDMHVGEGTTVRGELAGGIVLYVVGTGRRLPLRRLPLMRSVAVVGMRCVVRISCARVL